jgi:uroporphyrinogen-III synthase
MPDAPYEAPSGGKPRVVVTRRVEQAAILGEKLIAAGFQPLYFPTIELQVLPASELDGALAEIDCVDWLLFSSVNAVRFFFRRLAELKLSPKLPRTAVVGPATARKLAAYGIEPDFMPEHFTGEALAEGLGDLSGQRILLPRARIGGPKIVERLRRQGAQVRDIALYDTVTAVPDEAALAALGQGYEAISFTSPSSVRGFLEISGGKPLETAVVACIGPVTAEAAVNCGLTVTLVPDDYTLDGLVQVLSDYGFPPSRK